MNRFLEIFGEEPTHHVTTHGRVNLIGEHTDYNGGFVLPTNIPQATHVSLRPRNDGVVRLASLNISDPSAITTSEYALGRETHGRHWTDYIKGVTVALRKAGHQFAGFDALVDSNVPIGSGLSSSAALEVGILKGINEMYALNLDGLEIARFGQMAENDFVGARVGIMDQMAVSLGRLGEALFIDTRDLTYLRFPLPPEMELLVINSGVSHSHAHGDYNQRRRECERACEILGVRQLRELEIDGLHRLKALPDVLHRRARHVVTENARVLAAVRALEAKDFEKLGALFNESHRSMRDDYEVSIPEIDALVEICGSLPEVFGARLTGGGFGGSIVALTKAGSAADLGEKVLTEYSSKTGRKGTVLVPR